MSNGTRYRGSSPNSLYSVSGQCGSVLVAPCSRRPVFIAGLGSASAGAWGWLLVRSRNDPWFWPLGLQQSLKPQQDLIPVQYPTFLCMRCVCREFCAMLLAAPPGADGVVAEPPELLIQVRGPLDYGAGLARRRARTAGTAIPVTACGWRALWSLVSPNQHAQQASHVGCLPPRP